MKYLLFLFFLKIGLVYFYWSVYNFLIFGVNNKIMYFDIVCILFLLNEWIGFVLSG